jgi:uncharacterized Zn finger protein
MDNKKGNFDFLKSEEVSELSESQQNDLFRVGEVVEIKNSRFRVQKIWNNKIQFKLLPKDE